MPSVNDQGRWRQKRDKGIVDDYDSPKELNGDDGKIVLYLCNMSYKFY